MTIFVTLQLIVTLDRIRNSCDVLQDSGASDTLWPRGHEGATREEKNLVRVHSSALLPTHQWKQPVPSKLI